MTHPDISPEDFAVLVAQTGLSLNSEETERMRISYKHIRRLSDLVRGPSLRGTEGAHIFPAYAATAQSRAANSTPYQSGRISEAEVDHG